jgi:hypothetical protein
MKFLHVELRIGWTTNERDPMNPMSNDEIEREAAARGVSRARASIDRCSA